MKVKYFFPAKGKFLFIIMALFTHCGFANNSNYTQPIELNGKNLTVEEVVKIARWNTPVKIDNQSLEKVKKSHQLLLLAAKKICRFMD